MRRRVVLLAAFCLTVPLVAAQDGKRTLRELDPKGVPAPADGKADRPRVIATAAELAAAVPDEAARAALAGRVDFATEQLLLFTWAGSGRDELTYEFKPRGCKAGITDVVFRYTPGSGAGPRPQARLVVVPKDRRTAWRVETGAGR